MLSHARVALLATIGLSFACVSHNDDGSDTTPTASVKAVIAGDLVELQLPFFTANLAAPFNSAGYTVNAYDSQALLSTNPTAFQTIGHSSPNPSTSCIKSGCAYAMALNGNNTSLPFGVVMTLSDGTGGGTYSDVAYTSGLSKAVLAAEEPNQAITNLVTFAVPTKTLTTVATALGSTVAPMIKQGVVIGIVVGPMGNIQKNSLPAPTTDATVTMTSNSDATLYSAGDYSGAAPTANTATTNSDGVFFALGGSVAGGKAQQLQFTVAKTGLTYATQTTAITPGYVTVAVFYAN